MLNTSASPTAADQHGTARGDFNMSELAELLEALPDEGWVVERTLSASQFETTQIVHRDKGLVDSKFIRKVFTREGGLGAAYQRVFAAQAAGAHFEHLPVVYDVAEVDDGISVVTQFVQGETLQHFVESGNYGVEVATSVGRQLCDAMQELHEGFEKPIVHRDLKPGNIMMSQGKLMLIDLGIARTWQVGGTRDTVRLGTPGYAPPEQFGYGQTTPQSDIYAAGMVVAFCLTGGDLAANLRETGFADPRIPEAFRPLLVKATALDASQRYANAAEMKAAIGEAVCQRHKPRVENSAQEQFAEAREGVSEPQRAASTHRRFTVPDSLGMVWNTLLVLAWALLAFLSLFASITGGTEFLDRMPVWLRLLDYLFAVVAPTAAIVVLLFDKRRLRKRFPALTRYTWPRVLVGCLVFAAADFLALALLNTLIR